MDNNYFGYTKEQLQSNPKIPLVILAENKDVFINIAQEMSGEIEKNNERNKKTVFICPVGPVGQYPYFVEMVNSRNINLKNTWFINMDEYLDDHKHWIDKQNKLSFRGFMDRVVYSMIKPELVMPENQRIFPDPQNTAHVPELIRELGGVDIAFGGIGITGHVAFNEPIDNLSPEEYLKLQTRVLEISPETRAVNSIGDLNGAVDAMPHYCVTVGINEIFTARKVRLACFREWHRAVVRQACYGEVSAHFPVTLMQNHPDARLTITELVANLGE